MAHIHHTPPVAIHHPHSAYNIGATHYEDDGSLNSTGTAYSVRHVATMRFPLWALLDITSRAGKVLRKVPNLDLCGRDRVDMTTPMFVRFFGPHAIARQPKGGYPVTVRMVGMMPKAERRALLHRAKHRTRRHRFNTLFLGDSLE